jgi:hypothetical protein
MALFNGEPVYPTVARFLPTVQPKTPTNGDVWYDVIRIPNGFYGMVSGVIVPFGMGFTLNPSIPQITVGADTALSGQVYTLTAASNASAGTTTYTGTFPAILTNLFQEVALTISGFTHAANNGTFVLSTCTLTSLVVNNPSGVAETHSGTATVVQPLSTATGRVVIRGEGTGSVPLQGSLLPAGLTIVTNPDTMQLVLGEEGNQTDLAILNVFQDPNGSHGFQIISICDGTGARPSFLEMTGTTVNIVLPDELTGFQATGTGFTPGASNGTVSLSVSTAGGTPSLLSLTLDALVGTSVNTSFSVVAPLAATGFAAASSSPLFSIAGNAWSGSVSTTDIWSIQNVLSLGSGPSQVSTLTISHPVATSATRNVSIVSPVGIGGTPTATAALDVQSTTQTFIPPRMTTTQKNAISSPVEGSVVYDITLHKLAVRTATAWEAVTSA